MDADDEGMPLWVKIVGAITLLLIGTFVVLALAGGDHGPDRHAPSTAAGAIPTGVGSVPLLGSPVEPSEDGGVYEAGASGTYVGAGWTGIATGGTFPAT